MCRDVLKPFSVGAIHRSPLSGDGWDKVRKVAHILKRCPPVGEEDVSIANQTTKREPQEGRRRDRLPIDFEGCDENDRLTKIEHRDGANVLSSYAYTMDDVGNILTQEEADGFTWTYGYDGRYRLTSAVLADGTRTRWRESYVYDDGDNMLTKTQPSSDTLNDGTYNGWTVQLLTWTGANGVLEAM